MADCNNRVEVHKKERDGLPWIVVNAYGVIAIARL